jgi:hypothetical protein
MTTRRLAAILAADVVGYSALMGRRSRVHLRIVWFMAGQLDVCLLLIQLDGISPEDQMHLAEGGDDLLFQPVQASVRSSAHHLGLSVAERCTPVTITMAPGCRACSFTASSWLAATSREARRSVPDRSSRVSLESVLRLIGHPPGPAAIQQHGR